MRSIDLATLTEEDWTTLVAGEREPFGALGSDVSWAPKTRYVGVLDERERLIAAAGLLVCEVRVAGTETFPVAGLGGVLVTRSHRGEGLARVLVARLLAIAAEQPARRAMLFCLRDRMGLYEKFGFAEISAPVRADQPGGAIEVPLRAMWLALAPGAGWPRGPVEVLGEPF